ncbi:MAG: hypothetical protein AAF400_03080, partial [Bacteroidota bacterium]
IMSVTQAIREEGRQEGMQARNLEIAQAMLQEGEPIAKIIRWTGLSEEKLKKRRLSPPRG